MKTLDINVKKRTAIGKHFSTKLRRTGMVPCVIYGNGEPVHISADHLTLSKIFASPEAFVLKLDIEGTQAEVVVKDAQFHPVTDKILHVDFLRFADNPVVVMVPVKIKGSAIGVLSGGKLTLHQRKLQLSGMPANIPSQIEIDVTDLALGKTVRISDIPISEFEIIGPEHTAVVSVHIPRAVKEEVAETTAAPVAAAPAAPAAPAAEEKKKEKKK